MGLVHRVVCPFTPQLSLVLINWPWRDGTLSCHWYTAVTGGIRTNYLAVASPALYHSETTLPRMSELPVLTFGVLYGSECWAVTKTDVHKIDALNQWCLRKLLGMKWYHHKQNDEMRWITGQQYPFGYCWSMAWHSTLPNLTPFSSAHHSA